MEEKNLSIEEIKNIINAEENINIEIYLEGGQDERD